MKIEIRPLKEDDAYTSVKWRNIPEIWQFTESSPKRQITIEDELAWIRKVVQDKTSFRFAILADGKYVGNIYLTDVEDGSAEYHIFIGDKDYWGKGVAKKASLLIRDYAKEALALNKLNLKVHEDNVAAVGLYHKLGFIESGKKGKFTIMSLVL